MAASSTPPTSPPPRGDQGKVRWRRFAAMFVPSFVAIAGMFVLAAQGAVGVSFAISGKPFTVTATQLTGSGFEQYGNVDLDASGNPHPVIVSAIGQATLNNLCQSVYLGPGMYLKINAGGKGTGGATASNLVVDATALTGNARFSQINIGQDPTTFNAIPNYSPPAATKGTFGQQAAGVTITNLNQTALATTAGVFTLPGLSLGFASSGC